MDVPILDQLYHFVDNIEASIVYDPGVRFDCDDIILCGVGGSAASGDFAADCCYTESGIPVRLVRYPCLPSWVDSRTLAVVSSYSGNTAETMEMYRQAKARGCTVVAVTSGGAMAREAASNGDLVVGLPSGMHPRHAIGYMIGYTLAIIRAAGGPDFRDRVLGFVPALRRFRDESALPEGCLARTLASDYEGRVPVMCTDCSLKSVAFRWKTQINENSKFVAFCDSMPSFAASADAWSSTERRNYLLTFLIGRDDGMSYGTARRVAVALPLEEAGSPVRIVRLTGGSTLENMFQAIIVGDYMSYYMAENRGVDPSEVRPVARVKEKLRAAGIDATPAQRGPTPSRRRTRASASPRRSGPWIPSRSCTSARCPTA